MAMFAVVCRWADRSGNVDRSGVEAIVLSAANANDALNAANALRPDLWEPGPTRNTTVCPAQLVEAMPCGVADAFQDAVIDVLRIHPARTDLLWTAVETYQTQRRQVDQR